MTQPVQMNLLDERLWIIMDSCQGMCNEPKGTSVWLGGNRAFSLCPSCITKAVAAMFVFLTKEVD